MFYARTTELSKLENTMQAIIWNVLSSMDVGV